MSHDTLAITWFGLWGVIWTLYFVLDSYSLGIGMLFPNLAKDRAERNQLQEAIGPFWAGNEVWLLTAGGATFAAFPIVYGDMFTFLYEPMMLILFALFFRATGLEFMHKDDHPKWQAAWKWAFCISSYAIAFLFGVAFTNLYLGLKINAAGLYEGNVFSLFRPYTLYGGAMFVSLFMTSGALWTMIKTEGEVAERAQKIALPASIVGAASLAMVMNGTANKTILFDKFADMPLLYIVPALSMLCALLTVGFVWKKKIGFAFTTLLLAITTFMATGFIGMFPNMLISQIDPAYSISLYDARGSQTNLTVMFWVAMIFVPIIIGYQLWSYTIFKEKLTKKNAKGY